MRRRRTINRKGTNARNGKATKPKRSSVAQRTSSSVAELQKQVSALIRELAESREQQTATSEVLKVISRSSVHLEKVLDLLVETVARLCRADHALMFRLRDNMYYLVAAQGLSPEAKEFFFTHPFAPGRGTLAGRVALERQVIHLTDVLRDPEYTHTAPKVSGARTSLGIPLLRDDELIGIFVAARTRVYPFTSKEIELATGFADQAVIAIENARLFDELRKRQAELRVTFDNMGDGVVMFDSLARLTAWNRNFQEMLGLPDAFLAQRPSYAEYFRYLAERGEYSAEVEAQLGPYIEDVGREIRLERTRADGRIIEVRRNPVPGGGFVLIYADVTERRKVEKALRESEKRANALLEQVADQARSAERTLELLVKITGIASSAPNVPILASACLKEICDSCHWQFGQVWYPDTKREVLVCSEESVAGVGEWVELREISLKTPMRKGHGVPGRIWETGAALWLTDPTAEINELAADGSRAFVTQEAGSVFFPRNLARQEFGLGALMGFPVKLDKEVLAVFEFFSRERRPPDLSFMDAVEKLGRLLGDVLERKRAGEALRSSEERLRTAQTELARVARLTTVGEMAAAIAHELNQPLGAITVNGTAALRWINRPTPDLDEVRAALSHIVNDGRRASDVVDSIRAMFKQDSKERAPVDIKEIIQEVIALVHGETERHRIIVSTNLDELPKLLGHRVQLQQVILNLIVNAVEAMGSIDDRARILRVAAQVLDPKGLMISIEDSGCGIEPKDIDRIFERFFTTKSHGIGMGLWICRSIVEAHDGRLWAEPGIREGSVFRLLLPIPTATVVH